MVDPNDRQRYTSTNSKDPKVSWIRGIPSEIKYYVLHTYVPTSKAPQTAKISRSNYPKQHNRNAQQERFTRQQCCSKTVVALNLDDDSALYLRERACVPENLSHQQKRASCETLPWRFLPLELLTDMSPRLLNEIALIKMIDSKTTES